MSSVLESLTVSRRALLTTLAALIALNAFTLRGARAEYPERPITLIVCFPPGGGADISARLINTPLGDALGKPVIIENRGGAGGNIATVAVARARPDGYTLLMCSSAFVVNPSLYANVAYDPYKDFMPIMVLAVSPNVFVVPAQSAIKTMTEFLGQGEGESRQAQLDEFLALARPRILPARFSSCAPGSIWCISPTPVRDLQL